MNTIKLGSSKIITGTDALSYLSGMKNEIHRALIIMGKGSLVRNGSLKKLQDALAEGGIENDVFMGVEADPTFTTVMHGAEKAKAYRPDAIIGFGGGSAMDAAKVIWAFYENPELTSLTSILLPNTIPVLGEKAQLICIPTTAGTGSEATHVAVITDDTDPDNHVKCAVVDLSLRMIPTLSLLCPEFTTSVPASVTAASGMDAMTHAIEAYVCISANPFSDVMAMGAFEQAYKYLPLAYENGKNVEYRGRMLIASCVAGISFANCSLGIAHSIAHALGAKYGIAHGVACALALPHVIEYNSQDAAVNTKYKEMADAVGFHNLEDAIYHMCERLNVPTCLRGYFESREAFQKDLPKLAATAVADVSVLGNPVPVTVDSMLGILSGMY